MMEKKSPEGEVSFVEGGLRIRGEGELCEDLGGGLGMAGFGRWRTGTGTSSSGWFW